MGFYKKWMEIQEEQPPTPELVEHVNTFPEKHQKAHLPDTCPLVTGGVCPSGCRFNPKLLTRMIETGFLPDPDKGCPLKHVCGEHRKI